MYLQESWRSLHCWSLLKICDWADRQCHSLKLTALSPGLTLGQDWIFHQSAACTGLLCCLHTDKVMAGLGEKESKHPFFHFLLNTLIEKSRSELKIHKALQQKSAIFSRKKRKSLLHAVLDFSNSWLLCSQSLSINTSSGWFLVPVTCH